MAFNIFLSFASIGLYSEQINPTKQELWDAKSAEVNQWTDRRGTPIDEEIKDTIIALNLMGITTRSSCGGHLEHGYSYPFVDIQIATSKLYKMNLKYFDIQEQMKNELLSLKTKFPNLSYNDIFDLPEGENLRNLTDKRKVLEMSIRQIEIKNLEPLTKLINQFYKNHKISYENMLIVTNDSRFSLRSIGADRQVIRSQKRRLRYLNDYREEMKAFTNFLKQKFMN
jgi:hypothetical protein